MTQTDGNPCAFGGSIRAIQNYTSTTFGFCVINRKISICALGKGIVCDSND